MRVCAGWLSAGGWWRRWGRVSCGLHGVVGGMMVVVAVAFAMRLARDGSAVAMRWTSGEMV